MSLSCLTQITTRSSVQPQAWLGWLPTNQWLVIKEKKGDNEEDTFLSGLLASKSLRSLLWKAFVTRLSSQTIFPPYSIEFIVTKI